MQLQTEENDCLAKLNRTKERLNDFNTPEKIFYGKNRKRKNSDL